MDSFSGGLDPILRLQANGGTITITGVIGGMTPLGELFSTGSTALNINNIGNGSSPGLSGSTTPLVLENTTSTTLTGTYYNTSGGPQAWGDSTGNAPISLSNGPVTIISNGSNITIANSLSGAETLTINAGAGIVALNSATGSTGSPTPLTGLASQPAPSIFMATSQRLPGLLP